MATVDKKLLLEKFKDIQIEAERLLNDKSVTWEDSDAEAESDIQLKWYKPDYWAGTAYRFETVVDCDLETLFDSLYMRNREVWDENIDNTEELAELDDCTLFIKMNMNPTFEGLVSARDAIELFRYGTDGPDKRWIIQGSIDGFDEDYPAAEGFVRSFVHPTVVLLTRIDKDHTRFECCIQIDIKGWIPLVVTDMKMPEVLGGFVANMKEFVSKGTKPTAKGLPGRKKI